MVKKSSYKPLRFFYLLKDDIFISKDRTKFFDFIIPIIPVIDSSNSYDQLIAHLEDGKVYQLFNSPFLREVSLYIDDMRILKNIYNEFMVYYHRLKKAVDALDPNKMLAMIAYKNLFPRDFCALQLKKGFVFALFNNKSEFIAKKKDMLEKQIKEKRLLIENANKEHLRDLNECAIIQKERPVQIRNENKGNIYSIEYTQAIEKLTAELTDRRMAIENRLNGNIAIFEDEIAILQSSILRVVNEPLRGIITPENITDIFSITDTNEIGIKTDFKDVRGNDYFDLLKYLIRNGYIDETYTDYMTYFYPNSISQADKVFLLSVFNQDRREHSYELKDPFKVVERLSINHFEKPEVLNFSLMFHLLNNPAETADFLDAFFAQLKNSKNFDYAEKVLVLTNEHPQDDENLVSFINKVNQSWCEFLFSIIHNALLSEANRDRFVLLTLYHADNDTITAINRDDCLTKFISKKADFLNIKEPIIGRLISRFEYLGVSFETIEYDVSNEPLFEAVYENSLYELTFENISQMLIHMYNFDKSDDFRHKNYTLISSDTKSALAEFVSNNIDDYVKKIIANCDGKIEDDEKVVLAVLNYDGNNLPVETKKAYINVLTTVINKLTDVDDSDLWKLLVERGIAEHSEKNVIDYYSICKNEVAEELVRFINADTHEYNYSCSKNDYDEEILSAFFDSVLSCNALNNKHYVEVLKSLGYIYTDGFSVADVDKDKISLLIDSGIILMHRDALDFFRGHYSHAVNRYIEKYTAKYIEILDDTLFQFDEMMALLDLNVSDIYKIKALAFTDEKISVIDKNYSDTLKAHILEHNFDANDMNTLVRNYPKEGNLTKAVLENRVIENIEYIFDNGLKTSMELFQKILSGSKTNDVKVKLFACVLVDFSEEQCKQYVSKLDMADGYLTVFDGKRPTIPVDVVSERILTIYKNKGWITRFEPDEKDETVYRVIGRKSRRDDEDMILD